MEQSRALLLQHRIVLFLLHRSVFGLGRLSCSTRFDTLFYEQLTFQFLHNFMQHRHQLFISEAIFSLCKTIYIHVISIRNKNERTSHKIVQEFLQQNIAFYDTAFYFWYYKTIFDSWYKQYREWFVWVNRFFPFRVLVDWYRIISMGILNTESSSFIFAPWWRRRWWQEQPYIAFPLPKKKLWFKCNSLPWSIQDR